ASRCATRHDEPRAAPVLRQNDPRRHQDTRPARRRGIGGPADLRAAAVQRSQRPRGLAVLRQLSQSLVPEAHRGRLRLSLLMGNGEPMHGLPPTTEWRTITFLDDIRFDIAINTASPDLITQVYAEGRFPHSPYSTLLPHLLRPGSAVLDL